jgi:hypothetical protein
MDLVGVVVVVVVPVLVRLPCVVGVVVVGVVVVGVVVVGVVVVGVVVVAWAYTPAGVHANIRQALNQAMHRLLFMATSPRPGKKKRL